ncbi:split-Soret cytochrome c [Desulfocurvibacter africanus]|uniref:split-Soret cytochrome c n=1 Tax=Desulfocurvibacter africanus TaxID=873 RepID=UPI00047F74A0|nr:C-GCAxxG-C-C family protein [Desulfocurvibacter africanus]
MKISRRKALGIVGCTVVGGTMAATMGTSLAFTQKDKEFSWTPHKLDPAESALVGYNGYYYKGLGCCYGAFYGIVGIMGERYGAPYSQFPFSMMEVGKSGISEWGTICGALLGAASAFALFWGREERDPMVTELFRWYQQAAFPIFEPSEATNPKGVKGPIPTSVSGSPLCHISVSKWCYETKIEAGSKERGERCARLTADVTAKAIEIMNAKIDGKFAALYGSTDAEKSCVECHGKGKEAAYNKTKMDCTPCHSGSEHSTNKFKDHP